MSARLGVDVDSVVELAQSLFSGKAPLLVEVEWGRRPVALATGGAPAVAVAVATTTTFGANSDTRRRVRLAGWTTRDRRS